MRIDPSPVSRFPEMGRGSGAQPSSEPLRILVAGAGYVGLEAARQLEARGDRVFALRRSSGPLPAGVEGIMADLTAPDLGDRIPEVDYVLYTAAADGGDEASYRAIYQRGVAALLEVLEARPTAARPQRFVFVSSTAVYGEANGELVDESTPPEPASFRGAVMLEGEARVLASPIQGHVLRLGGIYGPGRDRLPRMVAAGEARCPGGGALWSNRIHRDDAARALIHLIDHPDPPAVLLGVDAEPTPICQVYQWLARQLGAPDPPVDPALRRDRANKRCSSARLQATGFRFLYPSFREGYGAMLEGS
jgi:nucleoside-diphosphate-sugar epimerase